MKASQQQQAHKEEATEDKARPTLACCGLSLKNYFSTHAIFCGSRDQANGYLCAAWSILLMLGGSTIIAMVRTFTSLLD
jgi:hypothetical protein